MRSWRILGLVVAAMSCASQTRGAALAGSWWAAASPPAGYADLCGVDPACLSPATGTPSATDFPQSFDWRDAFKDAEGTSFARRDLPTVPKEDLEQLLAWLADVNRRVNANVRPPPRHGSTGRQWRLPLKDGSGLGDCKAVALEKRRLLGLAGLSSSRLALAVVMTPNRQAHAVVLVASSAGEYVLDSLSPWLMPLEATGYRLVERQAYGTPGAWLKPYGAV